MTEGDSTNSTGEKAWWSTFFRVYAETGMVITAAKAARVGRRTVYTYKRECPEFARRWAECEAQALGTLEDMATQRALKSSDTLLIFLLKTRGREKYAEVIEQRQTGPGGGPQQHEVKLIGSTEQLRALAWPDTQADDGDSAPPTGGDASD